MSGSDWLWWRDGSIYHIYLRSFADSNGDGLGDLPGLIDRLDYLNGTPDSLGIDAIWISPCFPSPDKDFGYDVADYTAIDPRYGTLADFDRLIAEAHRRGIRVLLDLVYNHTSDQHPWFLDSRASRTSPYRDWYVWRDARPGGDPPNNWQAVFGGKAWTWDAATRQYYYHMFLREQPDLNWHNPKVRQALMEATRFWLDRGVDGFRLDVFNAWYEDAGYPDNPTKLGLRGFDRQRHIYDVDQPEMHTALAEFRSLLDAYPERASVGEPFSSDPMRVASYCNNRALHMVFNFEFSDRRWDPQAFCTSIESAERHIGDEAWPCYVLSNHDLSRHVSRYGGHHPAEVARVAAALLLTQRGTPFLYYGEEIGLPDAPLRRDQLVDPPGRKYWPFYKGRDPNRGPMHWDAGPNAGFTTGNPWLTLRSDFPQLNAASQRRDPRSVWSFYRDLLRLRRETPALRRGVFERLSQPSHDGLAYLRSTTEQQALIALNFRGDPVHLELQRPSDPSAWSLALVAHPDRAKDLSANGVALGAFQAAVFIRSTRGTRDVPRRPGAGPPLAVWPVAPSIGPREGDSLMSVSTIRLLIAGALFVHGLGHVGALGALAWVGRGEDAGGWRAARTWLFPSLPQRAATVLASVFWVVSLIGFVAAAMSFWGLLFPAAAWRSLALFSACVSGLGILLFFGTWPMFNTLAAIAMNIAVLVTQLWTHWPPFDMFGR